MKYSSITMILGVILSASCVTGRGDLILTAGESWAYEITADQWQWVEVVQQPDAPPVGSFFIALEGHNSSVDNALAEMFEDSPSEDPTFTTTSEDDWFASGGALHNWQDLQGWVQLSVFEGSVTLKSIQFDVYVVVGGDDMDRYQAIIQIPEPSVLALLGVGMVLVWRLRPNRAM